MIVFRAWVLFLVITLVPVRAAETIRQGVPKPCYIFSAGKGPRWIAPVGVEFQAGHFQWEQPLVDDSFFEPTGEALKWVKKRLESNVEDIGQVDGRRVIKVECRNDEPATLNKICVILAVETESDSGWFAPFYVIDSEAFKGCFVSGKDVAFGYVATLSFSGTGAYRTHHLFDLKGKHPKLVRTVNSGRVRRMDFDSDAAYEKALKSWDDEKAIFRGELAVEEKAAGPEQKAGKTKRE